VSTSGLPEWLRSSWQWSGRGKYRSVVIGNADGACFALKNVGSVESKLGGPDGHSPFIQHTVVTITFVLVVGALAMS
jgi:hypothetical protein